MADLSIKNLVDRGLVASRRPEDGLLHCSTDLLGPLRHAMLRITGAPYRGEPEASLIRLQTGTLWHEWIVRRAREEKLRVMSEVDVSDGLPEGWSGTLDHLFWDPEMKAWRVKDVKTQRAEAFAFDGGKVKPDHQAQLSAYWHGAVAIGLELVKELEVAYIPMNVAKSDKGDVEIDERACDVLDQDPLWQMMAEKKVALDAYVKAFQRRIEQAGEKAERGSDDEEWWLLPELADTPPRVQKLVNRYDGKGPKKVLASIDLKQVPDWRAAYCPYPAPLCYCEQQGETKIGEYTPAGSAWLYTPRDGYDHIKPVLEPEGGVITF